MNICCMYYKCYYELYYDYYNNNSVFPWLVFAANASKRRSQSYKEKASPFHLA